MKFLGLPFTILGSLFLTSLSALCAPIIFTEERVEPPLVVQDTEVGQVVSTLMQRYSVPVRVVGKFPGKISGRFSDIFVKELLDHLSAIYGFYWYYDGSFLEIGPVGDVGVKLLQVAPTRIDAFTAEIDGAGLDISQFPISFNRATGTMIAKGPEALLSMLESIAGLHQAPAEHHETTQTAPVQDETKEQVEILYGRAKRTQWPGPIQ